MSDICSPCRWMTAQATDCPEGLARILFASCHGYLDPSSGAARAMRELLELLARRGIDCRVLSTGVLDYRQQTPLDSVLAPLAVPVRRARTPLANAGNVEVFHLEVNGVQVTLLPTASSRIECFCDAVEPETFLQLADEVFDRFRPQVLLTYGGHPANIELMARARHQRIPVVFHLHNFAYTNPGTFANTAAVVVPSDYSRRYYAERLGLSCAVFPNPIDLERVVAPQPQPRFLTFVNPVAQKGVTVFARIALELGRRRPDIPLLIVEGRGTAQDLARVGLNLSELTNLYRMDNTPDPRNFYRVSRAILMPSLWREARSRVVDEALANGLPVLASDRGGLPEALADAGFLFPLPERCTPTSGAVPTAEEVAPWLETIERLWDDSAWEAEQQARARLAARRLDQDRIVADYVAFLSNLISREVLVQRGATPGTATDWLIWTGQAVERDPTMTREDRTTAGQTDGSCLTSQPATPGEVIPFRVPPARPGSSTPSASCQRVAGPTTAG